MIKLGLALVLAALAVPAPTYGQFLPGSQDQQALREVSLELAPARGDSRIVAQAGAMAPETAEKATSPPTPGDYTPEQIAEMINNPLGNLWLLNVQSTSTWFSGALVDRAKPLGSAQSSTLIQPVLSMQLAPDIRWLSLAFAADYSDQQLPAPEQLHHTYRPVRADHGDDHVRPDHGPRRHPVAKLFLHQ